MKQHISASRRILCALLSVLFVFLLTACRDATPAGLDLSANDGGAGRDTGFSSDVADPSDSPVTDAQTDAPDTTVPETDPPATEPPETTFTYPRYDDDGIITICLDAGHGFGDVGTDSEFLGELSEKDITLPIVLKIKDKLEALGFAVILTHDGQTFPKSAIDNGDNLFNPKERISYAHTQNIDYFLSIHCDSYAADSSVKGTRVYYSMGTPYESNSAAAANQIMKGINSALPNAKKTIVRNMEFDSAYYVIRMAHTPSALIEIGFVTNPTDAENMLSEDWQNALADGIANGLADYFT